MASARFRATGVAPGMARVGGTFLVTCRDPKTKATVAQQRLLRTVALIKDDLLRDRNVRS